MGSLGTYSNNTPEFSVPFCFPIKVKPAYLFPLFGKDLRVALRIRSASEEGHDWRIYRPTFSYYDAVFGRISRIFAIIVFFIPPLLLPHLFFSIQLSIFNHSPISPQCTPNQTPVLPASKRNEVILQSSAIVLLDYGQYRLLIEAQQLLRIQPSALHNKYPISPTRYSSFSFFFISIPNNVSY